MTHDEKPFMLKENGTMTAEFIIIPIEKKKGAQECVDFRTI